MREFQRWLRDIERRQIPFAVTTALTKTAFSAREAEMKDIPRRFRLKAKSLPRAALRVEKAKKADWPDRCESALGILPEFRFLADHEKGTIRKPLSGSGRLAIPTAAIKRTAKGKIRKNQTPRAIARRKTSSVHNGMILRKTRGRDRRQVTYMLRRRIKIKPRLFMHVTVAEAVRTTFEGHFVTAFERAVSTARK